MSLFGPINRVLDPNVVVRQFLEHYYGTVKNTGWHNTVRLYDYGCNVSVNGRDMTPHNLVHQLHLSGIRRGDIDSNYASWKQVGDNVIITVSCGMTYITPYGYVKYRKTLIDVFAISLSKLKIVFHSMQVR